MHECQLWAGSGQTALRHRSRRKVENAVCHVCRRVSLYGCAVDKGGRAELTSRLTRRFKVITENLILQREIRRRLSRIRGINLSNGFVKPLSKRRSDGTLYTRRPDVEQALTTLTMQPRENIISALKIRDKMSEHYLKSECIVYLIRSTREDNDDSYFNELYRELMRRLASALPRASSGAAGRSEDIHDAAGRERIKDTLNVKLIEDRKEPGSALDYFEVMFDAAIRALRSTSMHKARKHALRTHPIEADEETNEPSLAVERAVGSLDLKDELLSEDPIYRLRVADAIRSLPDKHRRVIELFLSDMPISSTDDSVLTIQKVIGVRSEKTVRNRRDEAYQMIREALSIGERP